MKREATILVSGFAFLLLTTVTSAGERSTQVAVSPISNQLSVGDKLYAQSDTLFLGFFDCTPSLFRAGANGELGYVAGNNQFGDLEKAQKYEGTGGGTVTEFVVWVGEKSVGGNGNVVGKIYDVDGSGAPGQVLGTSAPVAMSDVIASTNVEFTAFMFATPVTVGDDFFCSVELSQTSGDSIGIVTTDENCTSGSNTTANAWELFGDGVTWLPFDDSDSWRLTIDMAVFPVFEQLTSVDERSDQVPTDFSLDQNYPNPFNPSTRIGFSLPQSAEVTLIIYNLLGQEVVTLLENTPYASGRHEVHFDASNLSDGIYFYKIETTNFVDIRKMTLLK